VVQKLLVKLERSKVASVKVESRPH